MATPETARGDGAAAVPELVMSATIPLGASGVPDAVTWSKTFQIDHAQKTTPTPTAEYVRKVTISLHTARVSSTSKHRRRVGRFSRGRHAAAAFHPAHYRRATRPSTTTHRTAPHTVPHEAMAPARRRRTAPAQGRGCHVPPAHGHTADDGTRGAPRRSLTGMTELWTDHAREALRIACHTADGPSLLALLRTHDCGGVVQQCGDALTAAVWRDLPGARQTATGCAAALRERGWAGDEVLAGQLDTAATGGDLGLQPLPVDLEELSGLLEGDLVWGGGRIDVTTGECWPAAIDTEEVGDEEEWDDPERWLPVPSAGSRDAYRDLEDFITTLDDQDLAGFLSIAIQGPGAFRRFKDMLATSPVQLQRYWLFSAERQYGRARAWLADHGYRPTPPGSR